MTTVYSDYVNDFTSIMSRREGSPIVKSTDIPKTPKGHQKMIKYLKYQWKTSIVFLCHTSWGSFYFIFLPLSLLPTESLCLTLRLTLTALNMQGQSCQTDLWIPNSPESCSIFHWSWIFKKINPLKTYKTYRSGALCPKNKIASAISHYRQPHQPPSFNCFPLCFPLSLTKPIW